MKLLYAEDERSLAEAVVDVLEYHKYKVDVVYDGQDALDWAANDSYDGIILDVMMPKLSGLEVLKRLRAKGDRTPILLLTAKAEVEDRIQGLDLGADDYLPKPFAMGELLARIRAMLRRREDFTPDLLTMGRMCFSDWKLSICSGLCRCSEYVRVRTAFSVENWRPPQAAADVVLLAALQLLPGPEVDPPARGQEDLPVLQSLFQDRADVELAAEEIAVGVPAGAVVHGLPEVRPQSGQALPGLRQAAEQIGASGRCGPSSASRCRAGPPGRQTGRWPRAAGIRGSA